jgi:nucleotide-binding universal stress UspA family protein
MIDRILFPVDFSPSCASMAPFVQRAATLFGSSVTLLHVCDLMSHDGFELYVRSPQEIAENHLCVAQAELKSFLAPQFPQGTCSRILRSGDPPAEIADVAVREDIDLIVMPTHAGRFRRLVLGSTTAKVLGRVPCPVLTTKHAETIVPLPLEHRVWLCAVSLTSDSERILAFASRAAATAGAKLFVIHIIDAHDRIQTVEKSARRRMEKLAQKVGWEGELKIAVGPRKLALLEAARTCDADLIVIGRALGSSPFDQIQGLSYELIRDSPCPVVSV